MSTCRYYGKCAGTCDGHGLCVSFRNVTYYCESFEPMPDVDALLALADLLRTPELETDCGTCPLRKWCEEARDSGNRITCFECKLWHTADAIREACGEEAKDEA